MYDYIVAELPALIQMNFPVAQGRESIFGHSMGGHGALTIALSNYLGDDRKSWLAYDANYLVTGVTDLSRAAPMLIDQGEADGFLEEQLNFELFQETCRAVNYPLTARLQPGYDHSYYFIASFMQDHMEFHASALQA